MNYNRAMDDTTTGRDFTAGTLARAAGVSPSYVARLCRLGILPAVKVAGAVWVIRYADGAAWLAQREAKQRETQSES